LLLATSAVLIFGSLMFLVRMLGHALRNRVSRMVERALARSALLAMSIGLLATVMVQSSSITLSLLVPLAGAGLLSLRKAYPVVLGANLGTTVTALLAALGTAGPNASAGLTIALVHMLFNLVGILLFFPIAALREIPQGGSRWLASVAEKSPGWAVLWVIALFYGLPAGLAFLARGS
jgi:sodium-dependent phosphate cotransporter